MQLRNSIIILLIAGPLLCFGQDDLLSQLEAETPTIKEPVTATFKTTRLINGHSIENVAAGVLDLRISHRFGKLNSGSYNLWGLDQATMRIGLEYGITPRLMVGVGRSTYQKQFDGFAKYKVLRQQENSGMPISLSVTANTMYKSIRFSDPNRVNYYTSNLFYSGQLLIARKFSESLSLQLMPTLIHYNLVENVGDPNDLISVGVGGRFKLSKRISLNAEYYYQIPSYQFAGTYNSFAIGFDIETGGHVFQLNFTNSTGMTERSFITETTGNFFKGDIHFGFTISRVFTLKEPRK